VTNKAVFADGHQLADKRVRLDASSIADLHTTLDFHERSNEHSVAKLALVQIHGLYDRCPGAHSHIAHAGLKFTKLGHDFTSTDEKFTGPSKSSNDRLTFKA